MRHTNTQKHPKTNIYTLQLQQNECWDMTGFEDSGWWPFQEGLSFFCRHIFAPFTHCKYDFIPFTSHQWVSTWKLITGHITLSDVPSKTEHRILYAMKYYGDDSQRPFGNHPWQKPFLMTFFKKVISFKKKKVFGMGCLQAFGNIPPSIILYSSLWGSPPSGYDK